MNTIKEHPLPKKAFENLASRHSKNCISIFLPLYKSGKEQNEHLAQATLKKCIKDVKNALREQHLSEDEIYDYMQPITELLTTLDIWRKPSNGLAIFLDSDGLVYHKLPLPFKVTTYVASHFYVKPLLPIYTDDGLYYLLALSMDHLKLYQTSRYTLQDTYIEDYAPDILEKAVGYDFDPKMLQFRSGQAANRAGSFHGHGEGKDDELKEIINYFRAIDAGVNQIITNTKSPLLLACVDKLYPIFKETSSYPSLFKKYIPGNPEVMSLDQLHSASWKLVKPHFEEIKNDKLAKFEELYHTSKTSNELSDTISAAVNGKIETLFIQDDIDLYGIYDQRTNRLHIDTEKKAANASLLNLAALHTLKQGGDVFLLNKEKMPVENQPLSALLRY